MLRRVILGPRRFFYVLHTYGMYDVLCCVTASACGHRYRLIFLILFVGLKKTCTHCSVGKNEPQAVIFIASSYYEGLLIAN